MNRSLFRSLLSSVLVVVAVGAVVGPVLAQGKTTVVRGGDANAAPAQPALLPLDEVLTGEAREEYDRANMLVEVKEYAAAILKFRRAYKLQPEPRLLKDIAACEKDLRHYARAFALLQEYREKAKDLIAQEEERYLRRLEATFLGLTSEMNVMVSEAGAVVLVDGETVGISPISKPIRVDLGMRRIAVELRGFKPFLEERSVYGGVPFTVVAHLDREQIRARVVVKAGANDLIAIDGRVVALGQYDGYVRVGWHSVRVSAPGMIPQEKELTFREGDVHTVAFSLRASPPTADVSRWMWIGGGIALLAGGLIAGSMLYKAPKAPPAEGSWGQTDGSR